MPNSWARLALGHPGKLEFVEEDRVEVVVNDQGGGNYQLKGILMDLKEVGTSVYLAVSINKCVIDHGLPCRSIRMRRLRTTCTRWRRSECIVSTGPHCRARARAMWRDGGGHIVFQRQGDRKRRA